jgi:hypothetical protein
MIDESEKLRNWVKYLIKELDKRIENFSAAGVSSLPAFRSASGNAFLHW